MSEASDDPPRHYTIILALGSNMGDRAAALRTAVEKLAPYVTITAKSKIYETPSAYASDQPDYLNAVVMGTTKLEPLTLLWVVKDLGKRDRPPANLSLWPTGYRY